MELRHLRYFVTIAEERSFSRAAERLWLAQPGLSTQIRRLEAEIGVKVFARHSRGVDLTPAGELLLERARLALAAVDAATATGRDLEAGTVGRMRLGIASGARWGRAVEVLQRFTGERPGIDLSVHEAYAGALWRDLRRGDLDAVIAPTGHASFDLHKRELGSEAWVVLTGTRHPLAGLGPLAAGDLQGQRVALTGHPDDAVLDAAVRGLLAEFAVSAEFVSGVPGPALHSVVAEGDVVALTTAPAALPAGVLARRLEPRRSLSFELLFSDEVSCAGFIDTATESTRSLKVVA